MLSVVHAVDFCLFVSREGGFLVEAKDDRTEWCTYFCR